MNYETIATLVWSDIERVDFITNKKHDAFEVAE